MRISVADVQSWTDLAISIITIIGLGAAARLAIGQYRLYRKLIANAREIREERASIAANYQHVTIAAGRKSDYLESANTQDYVAYANDGPAPISKLEQLQEDRQFILDELLFVKK